MISILRRLRKSLITENKFSKYLIYAFGEIILVVIGILIALQINNWNEERKIKLEEQNIRQNLVADFENNEKQLQKVKDETNNGIESSLEMLNYTGNKEKLATSEKFDSILNQIFISPAFRPVIGTLNEITNSGKLGNISNPELRKLLATWPAIIEVVNVQYAASEHNERLLNEYIIEHGNWLNADQVNSKERNVIFPKSGFISDNRELLKSQHFENLIENNAIGLDNYLSRLNEASKLLTRIQQITNSAENND